jgi:hypothetical protein
VLEQADPWLVELCAELPVDRQLALAYQGQEEAYARWAKKGGAHGWTRGNGRMRRWLRTMFTPQTSDVRRAGRAVARPRGRRPRGRHRSRALAREPDEPPPPLGRPAEQTRAKDAA